MFRELKDRLKKWLLQDELNRLQYVENNIEHITNMADYAKDLFFNAEKSCRKSDAEMIRCIRTCEQLRDVCTPLLDVGTDIGFGQDHSWAVVCVKGKPEYVKFIPLDGKDTRQIISFLKRYEKSNNVIDSPLAYRGMFDRKMFV